MDNETYRIRVEDLFRELFEEEPEAAAVVADGGGAVSAVSRTQNEAVRRQLEELALLPRKARHFLRVLNDQPQDVQADFLRYVMANVKDKDFPRDLERHVRHRFYEAREPFKQLLAEMDDETSIDAIMKVV